MTGIMRNGKKVHAVKEAADKWSLGQALCGCTISRWTPKSNHPAEVTCPRCQKKLLALLADEQARRQQATN